MHALIRQGNGKYYVSAVFGYYKGINSANRHHRHHERGYSPYYVTWDEEKTKLVRTFAMQQNTEYLIPQLIIIESDMKNWIVQEDGTGGVDFLPREIADRLIETGELPADIREKCMAVDIGYKYESYSEIRTEKDIEDLYWASGGFHDAYIKKEEMQKDGKLYLLFDGTWGCKIEVWFWGDLEYDTSSRNPELYDPYWFGSTVIMQDGFIYFVDDDNMTVDKISEGYCYFKARHMRYHVIPD